MVLDTPPDPIWLGLFITWIGNALHISASTYGDMLTSLRFGYSLGQIAPMLVTTAIFVGASAAFNNALWDTDPMPHLYWILTISVLAWSFIWVFGVPKRCWLTPEGDPLGNGQKAGMALAVTFGSAVIMAIGIGIMVALRYFAAKDDPVMEILIISVIYPILRVGFKKMIFAIVDVMGLADADGDGKGGEDARLKNICRDTIGFEITFGGPGMCAAAALTSWGGFFTSLCMGAAVEVACDLLILYKKLNKMSPLDLLLCRKPEKQAKVHSEDAATTTKDSATTTNDSATTTNDSATTTNKEEKDKLLNFHEHRLSAEDLGEKISVMLSPLFMWAGIMIYIHHAEATAPGPASQVSNTMENSTMAANSTAISRLEIAESMRDLTPPAGIFVLRCLLMVLFEVFTHVVKNVALVRAFGLNFARVHIEVPVNNALTLAGSALALLGCVITGVAITAAM
ncbi:hypothetical protein TrCOL_g10139 [Triparma columacea]|uniref:Uncharacterized protein n=1 Tax=Triparma columacea TaxID=722753 RepID=A0A9W7G1B5_9STRA|nr:hypothetical protein TrCOL_g10139 [Triparma columacea]